MSSKPPTPPYHRRTNRRSKSPFATGTKIIASFFSLSVLVAFGYGWYDYRSLNQGTQRIAVAGLGGGGLSGARGQRAGTAENILVVGDDSRAGLTAAEEREYQVGTDALTTSTDTIMLVHVPADGTRATLISIPRDTYVEIPGHPYGKINAAYIDGYLYGGAVGERAQQAAGASLLVATVEKLTGVPINHYVQVGFAGFVDIVKAIGDIPIDLCESVDDGAAHNAAIGVDGGSGFVMSAGPHSLKPVQALEFVRQRHNIPGPTSDDLGRELRQRYFLSAAFGKITSAGVLLNPLRLQRLIKAVNGAFTFDSTGFDLLDFAEQMSALTAGQIGGRSIPTTGSHNYGGVVGDALTVDPAAVARTVQEQFGLLTPTAAAPHPRGTQSGTVASSTSPVVVAPAVTTTGPTATGRPCVH